jgi:hypothetical protein
VKDRDKTPRITGVILITLFPVLLFQREDLVRLILFMLLPKPPRLTKVRTEMMPKFC